MMHLPTRIGGTSSNWIDIRRRLGDIWRSWRRGGQAGGHRAAASAGDGKGEASID